MADSLHIQLAVPAAPSTIFHAWTDTGSLMAWFAESADVQLDQQRFGYWGRYTPGCPSRAQGYHRLTAVESGHLLRWTWNVAGHASEVAVTLAPRNDGTLVVVRHVIPTDHVIAVPNVEDFWFLSLENLRRHLDGRSDVVRCDFSAIRGGDIGHSVLIDGSRDEVFGALMRPEQLERWIASRATVEPMVGGRYELGWEQGGPVKILELVPNERLATTWPAEIETVVTWTLEDSGGKTRLTLVHSGFAPDQPTGGLDAGWLNFLSWIKSLVEYGPAWRPPLIAVPAPMRSYYAGSIGAAQHELAIPA